MDKHPNETKIKIKINGEERPFKEEMEIHNWSTGKEETAAGAENIVEDDQFDWVLPDVDENQVGEFKKIYYTDSHTTPSYSKKTKRNGNSNLAAIIFSIITAITIGILIGFFMLKIVIYESDAADAKKTATTAANDPTNKGSSQNTTIPIPSLTAALIQGGVFENAESTVNAIKAKGLPTMVLEMENQQYIYIGVAGNLDTSKTLAVAFKKQGVDVFAKELTFDGKSLTNATKDEGTLIESSVSLFQTIAQETTTAYLTGKANPESIKSIGEKIEQIEALKDIKNQNVKELRNYQVESYQSLLNFQKSNDKKELINGQQSLLSYIKQFNKLK